MWGIPKTNVSTVLRGFEVNPWMGPRDLVRIAGRRKKGIVESAERESGN
jgi:hypothetical protein